MGWPTVEKHQGYRVVTPPLRGKAQMYLAQFDGTKVQGTPWRPSLQRARYEGQVVRDQISAKLRLEAASGRRATKSELPNNHPSNHAGAVMQQAPLIIPFLWCVPDSRLNLDRLAQQHPPAAAAGGDYASAAAAAAEAAAERMQGLTMSDGAAMSLTGSFVSLDRCYHGGLPGMCIQLGNRLGSGGFADVFLGTVGALSGLQLSNAQHRQQLVEQMKAAYPPDQRYVAVKVFRSSCTGTTTEMLQKCALNELEALRRLRFNYSAVQLLAEGEPVLHSASSTSTAPGSSKLKRKFGKDAPSLQLPYCAVLEVCSLSLHDALRKGRCSEAQAYLVTRQVLDFLDCCQSGELGCVIVHRDLKPSNIMLRADGSVAVSDFGACCIIELPAAEVTDAAAAAAAAAAGNSTKQQPGQQQVVQPAAAPPVWPDPAAVAAAVAAPLHTCICTPLYAAPEIWRTAAAADALKGSKAAAAARYGGGNDGNCADDSAHNQAGSSSSKGPGFNASVDVFALGVVVAEMLVGSLHGLCEFGRNSHGAPSSPEEAQQWEQRLGHLVDGNVQLPGGVVLSAAVREFIGCCCGVGWDRMAAAALGQSKRMTPAQLKKTAWIQQFG